MNENRTHQMLVKLCAAAMMTAVVFVGNFLRITMPVPLGGVTSFTLANILCALSGILLGPWYGFLAAGLGSFFYDLTGTYAAEAPITLFTKGMYGLVAGLVLYCLLKSAKEKYGAQLAAATCAAVTYMALYLVKNYVYNAAILELTEPVQPPVRLYVRKYGRRHGPSCFCGCSVLECGQLSTNFLMQEGIKP